MQGEGIVGRVIDSAVEMFGPVGDPHCEVGRTASKVKRAADGVPMATGGADG